MLIINDLKTIKLAYTNINSKFIESMYLKFGIDFTRPVQIYGIINNRCNARCKMCLCWRENDKSELPAHLWIRALKSLKNFAGIFNINFSGGEPLLKKDIFEILEFCKNSNIIAGITTNGLLLDDERIKRIIDCGLFNINISIDSMEDTIHDGIRGISGILTKVKKNIDHLIKQREKGKSNLKIIVKPIVCPENIHGLDKIAEYVKETGINGVNYQPVFEWSEESKEMLNINYTSLDNMVNRLISMKRKGYPILNPEANIRQWVDHFKRTMPQRQSNCVVPLRNLTIQSNGDILLCGFLNSRIGNIENIPEDDFKTIWYSDKAKKMRADLIKCKRLCTATCVVKRSWRDYIGLFKSFIGKN